MSLEGIAPLWSELLSRVLHMWGRPAHQRRSGWRQDVSTVRRPGCYNKGGCRSELGQFHQFLLEVCLATCCSHSHSVMCNLLTTCSPDCTLHTAITHLGWRQDVSTVRWSLMWIAWLQYWYSRVSYTTHHQNSHMTLLFQNCNHVNRSHDMTEWICIK